MILTRKFRDYFKRNVLFFGIIFGIVTGLFFFSKGLLSRSEAQEPAGYSSHLGFVYSGTVNPSQVFPSTFESLRTRWTTSYTSYMVPRVANGVPLVSLGEESGYYYLPNLTHIGKGEKLIDVTPWTKPTWFPVESIYSPVNLKLK